VVLTAALSSLNAGLYSTGRILRSMAVAGSAPKFAARMNKAGVPYGGIAITAFVALFGVVINYVNPSDAFETVLNVAAVGILVTWATIIVCQMRLKQLADRGQLVRPSFRLFWAPYTSYLTLAFLVVVLVLVFIDSPSTLVVAIVASLLITAGWFACRRRIAALAAEREGYTGTCPVVPSPYSTD
jgi:L-asparagine permease